MKSRLIHTILFFIFFLFAITGCLNKVQVDYVAIIGGEKVSVPEFKMYLYDAKIYYESVGGEDIWDTDFEGKTAEEAAKEMALNSIAHVKISAQQAKKMNVSLNEEEKAIALVDAAKFLKNLDEDTLKYSNINEQQMTKIMEEKALYNKVYNETTKDFELSEKDFESTYQHYVNSNKNVLLDFDIKYDIQYIYLSTYTSEDGNLKVLSDEKKAEVLEKANYVLNKAKSGEDFTELVKQYSNDAKSVEENGREIISKGRYRTELENATMLLKENEVSDLITLDSGYYIIKLNDIIQPDEQSIKEEYRQKYIASKKEQIFEQEYESWESSSGKIEKNIEIWDGIQIFIS